MKNLFSFIVAAAVVFTDPGSAAPGQTHTPAKRALLVAVNGYNHGRLGDIHDLDTTPDVEMLKRVLMRPPCGFKESEIRILQRPAETTHKAIVEAFRTLLIEPTQEGDIIFFHYSGHGSDVADPSDKVSGRDQTLVPSDYASTTDGSNDIRDKEIARLLADLQQKKPGTVLLSFDSCHSGTITRGLAPVRGFSRVSPGPAAGAPRANTEAGLIGPGEIAKLGYVALSACRSDQVDTEALDDTSHLMGPLSYALSRALSEADEKTTYRDLFARVTSIVWQKCRGQDPQMEGLLDKVLFGSAVVKSERYIPIDLNRQNSAVLQAGTLQQVWGGSRLDIFPKGTTEFKRTQPIARAEVTDPSPTLSGLKVELMPGTRLADLRGARAVITERRYPDKPLTVDVSALPQSHPRRAAILDAIKDLEKRNLVTTRLADRSAAWDVRIVPAAMESGRGTAQPASPDSRPAEAGSVVLLRQDGSSLNVEIARGTFANTLPDNPDLPQRIQEALEGESRWRLVSDLSNPSPDNPFKVEVRIIPVEVESRPLGGVRWVKDRDLQTTVGGQIELKVGDYFRVEVRNSGSAGAYVTILDLRSDGKIGPVWPDPREATSNFVPARDQWIPITTSSGEKLVYVATDPTGTELFKAIATEYPADFSVLVDPETLSRGAPRGNARGAREAETPLGKLLMSATTRARAVPASVPTGGWGAFGLNFKVQPAGDMGR